MSTFGNTLAFHQLGCHAHFQTFAFRIGHAVKQALDGSGAKLAFSDLHSGKRRNHHIAHRNVIKADDGDILRNAVAVLAQRTHGGRRDDVIIGKVGIRDRSFRFEKAQHVAVAFV